MIFTTGYYIFALEKIAHCYTKDFYFVLGVFMVRGVGQDSVGGGGCTYLGMWGCAWGVP